VGERDLCAVVLHQAVADLQGETNPAFFASALSFLRLPANERLEIFCGGLGLDVDAVLERVDPILETRFGPLERSALTAQVANGEKMLREVCPKHVSPPAPTSVDELLVRIVWLIARLDHEARRLRNEKLPRNNRPGVHRGRRHKKKRPDRRKT
jgi:hypothetical protein